MIKNSATKQSLIPFLAISILINMVIFAYFFSRIDDSRKFSDLSDQLKNKPRHFKIDDIEIRPNLQNEKMKKVGIKDGVKGLNQPDILFKNLAPNLAQNLAEDFKEIQKTSPSAEPFPKKPILNSKRPIDIHPLKENDQSNTKSHFFYDPKNNQTISRSNEQESIKKQAINNLNVPSNKVQQALSGLEVRMERPEGVSEDELNDAEKMYYSFNVRMYKNFYTTIVTNFEKIKIQRPGLEKAMTEKHELLGKVEYDENGEIQSIKILKSSVNDDIHFFFEESLKQLRLPNPPKSKLDKDKTFNIYYLISIN